MIINNFEKKNMKKRCKSNNYHDRRCTKKIEDRFGFERELRIKSYVDVVVGPLRKVPLGDRGRFFLDREIVGAKVKLPTF